MPPWVSVAVPTQGREWPQGRDEGCLASHVESSVGPSWVQGTMKVVEAGSDEQMGANTVEYGLGMAGGTKAGEEYDGKGKRTVEETGDDSKEKGDDSEKMGDDYDSSFSLHLLSFSYSNPS